MYDGDAALCMTMVLQREGHRIRKTKHDGAIHGLNKHVNSDTKRNVKQREALSLPGPLPEPLPLPGPPLTMSEPQPKELLLPEPVQLPLPEQLPESLPHRSQLYSNIEVGSKGGCSDLIPR